MKKLTALIFALISLLVIVLAGCSNNETFTEKVYLIDTAEVENVIVQVTDRELEISTSNDNNIYIEYFDSEKEYLDIAINENKQLTIKLGVNKEWTDYIGTKPSKEYRKIKIKIPNNSISTFSASTTNENINITQLTFKKSIELNSNGGSINLERILSGESISLTAKNGDITGSIIGGWDEYSIKCEIKKGDCNLPLSKEGGTKSLYANCNNGDINIELIK